MIKNHLEDKFILLRVPIFLAMKKTEDSGSSAMTNQSLWPSVTLPWCDLSIGADSGYQALGKAQGAQFISVAFQGTECFSLGCWLLSGAQLALPLLAMLSAGKAPAAESTERSRGRQPYSLC